jgi:hypothetical protein
MDNQPDHKMTRSQRGGDGRFTRSPDTAARDAEAARLRGRGLSYPRIANELGYADHTGAYYAVQRALQATVEEPAAEVRQLELERLDTLYEAALKVLERRHVHVSGGKVVTQVTEYLTDDDGAIVVDEDGNPRPKEIQELEDDAPVLKAVETLLKIQARRAALQGLDAPVKADIGGKLSYEIIGVDPEQL